MERTRPVSNRKSLSLGTILEDFVKHPKLMIGLGTLALVIASATTFRVVTGHCPVECLMHCIHGDASQPGTPTTPAG
jgi:hypothetical protein